MIEVEKKFQPTEEQLNALLEGAEFKGEKIIHDLYYDYPDLRIYKAKNRLRKRDSGYEMKIKKKSDLSSVAIEIENDKEIKEFLRLQDDPRTLDEIVTEDMQPVCDFTTKRRKYTKEGFNIDVDETSFDYNVCEIERIVVTDEEIEEAEKLVIEFATRYGFEVKDLPLKSKAYLQKIKPDVYEQLKDYL